MNYRPWNDYKADCLNETLADIGKGLDTESWFPRAANEVIHDFRVRELRFLGGVVLFPDSQAALAWCWKSLNEDADRFGEAGYRMTADEAKAITAAMRRDGLMSDEDVAEAQEEASRHFAAQQAIDDQNCGEYE